MAIHSEADKERVRLMLADYRRRREESQPPKKAYREPIQPPVDGTGLTEAMRAHMGLPADEIGDVI